MANSSQHRCVFVGNIPYDATEEQLKEICEEVGPVVNFSLILIVEITISIAELLIEVVNALALLLVEEENLKRIEVDEETALSARRNLQGYEINGRQLRVDFAENDKGADRSREQGRGGPGLTSNVGGPAILGDSALLQPIGLQLSSTAASVMAGALGGVQTDCMSSKPNGLQSQSGVGNDPLTLYLANMTRKQLYDIVSEMKAQIMLGMVTPQVLQMSNIRQSPSSHLQSTLQDGLPDQKVPALPPYPGQSSLLQNKIQPGMMVNNKPSMTPFQQGSMQHRFQHPQQGQNQPFLSTTVPSQPGVSTLPALRPPMGLSLRPPVLESSTALKQQMQTPLLHNPRPVGTASNSQLVYPNSNHPAFLPRPSQPNFQLQPGTSNSNISSGMLDTVNKQVSGSNSNLLMGIPEQTGIAGNTFEAMHHPSQLARLEDRRSSVRTMVGQNATTAIGNQVLGTDTMQNTDRQVLQLAPEVRSALLEQVKSLTPEQLSSLPPEQRQQVIDLQKMLQ
ncbi:Cleavage stimulating factor [Thalictrum thalictroides]|uniref:Cleavage stimulating factor n=1 Tax=Thalictrum thalictroides TaxID=46969 RepID=A0A7J6UYS0_THATH|nr:Cleavage stimulating factor [Thalictrum thalictroides]